MKEKIEEVKGEEWPQEGDKYYYMDHYGDLQNDTWTHHKLDKERRDFLGTYRTKEEAQAVSDKVREFVKGLGK